LFNNDAGGSATDEALHNNDSEEVGLVFRGSIVDSPRRLNCRGALVPFFVPPTFGDESGCSATDEALHNHDIEKITPVARARIVASPRRLNCRGTLLSKFAPLLFGKVSRGSATDEALYNHDIEKVGLVTRARIVASPSTLDCRGALILKFPPLLLGYVTGSSSTKEALYNNDIAKVALITRLRIGTSPRILDCRRTAIPSFVPLLFNNDVGASTTDEALYNNDSEKVALVFRGSIVASPSCLNFRSALIGPVT
jgi:hypothetical protein